LSVIILGFGSSVVALRLVFTHGTLKSVLILSKVESMQESIKGSILTAWMREAITGDAVRFNTIIISVQRFKNASRVQSKSTRGEKDAPALYPPRKDWVISSTTEGRTAKDPANNLRFVEEIPTINLAISSSMGPTW
jgi:hypothetical protein